MRPTLSIRSLAAAASLLSLGCSVAEELDASARDVATERSLSDASVPDASSAPDAVSFDAPALADATIDSDATDATDAMNTELDAPVADAGPAISIPNSIDLLVGIIGTGQSLSVGATSNPAVSTRQPYLNVRLRDTGTPPLFDGVGDRLSLAPLVEPIRSEVTGGGALYPNNIAGETPHSGMANELSALAARLASVSFASAHSVVGESGRPIDYLRRGGIGRAFAASLYEARALTALALGEGRRYEVGAVVLTHGESDALNVNYGAALLELAQAYRADLPPITGQRAAIPMILSQQGSFPGGTGRALSTQAQWRASVDHRGVILCSGPKYQYEYSPDHVHLTATGSRSLGIKYAQVYAQTSFFGRPWRPLEPTSVRRVGATVVEVDFFVPSPPLAWESSIPMPHTTIHPTAGRPPAAWAAGRGFELEQAGRTVAITSVELRGSTVVITPSAPLALGDFTVRYAMTQDVPGYTAGTEFARAGQLRDSDPYVGHDRVSVTASVVNNDRRVRVSNVALLAGLGVRARVRNASGLPADGAVVTAAAANTLTLSEPWRGPSGDVSLEVFSDQRNYAVQFELVGR